jgi:hypothetical protein
MSYKNKKEIPLWAQLGHGKPTTRRELLAAGLMSFSASLIAPAYLRFLLPEAHAATVCATNASTLIPIVTLNLSGGSAMASNFVPVDQGGQFLPSYDLMGLGNGSGLPIEREFGNVPFAGMDNGNLISKFLQGLRQTSPTALSKTAFVAACVRTRDDSNENMLSIDGLVNAAGLRGAMLPNLGSRSNSVTGISQMPAVTAPSAPLVVNGFGSIQGSLGYAGAVGTALNQAQKVALANSIQKLSESQMRKLASMSVNEAVKGLVDCNNKKNQDIVGLSNAGIDPRTDATSGAALSTLWNINGGTNNNDRNLVFSTMVYNALKGNAGAASLEIGGYDYHDNTRTRGDAADLVAGQTVGRVLETAAILNRPLFLYVTSDGAVTSPKSESRNAPWSSDRGTAGASYIMYFDPAGRRTTLNNQIGWFTVGQAADDKTIIGNNPERSAIAVFANYLKLNNRMADFQRIVGRSFEVSKLDEVIRF